ncbi:MAG TPA: AAC(3) family N-acetyltransferase [bacterium]|nr:AAC(3) family N-acetyltransferase [bacterium]
MNNKKLYSQIYEIIDEKYLFYNIERLWKVEFGQTFKDYHNAAELTARLIKEVGLQNVEKISFPADGKTSYQDKITPLAWDASYGKLTIIKSPVSLQDNVVADYKRHPFHLIKGSVSTPPEGLNVRLITWEQLTHGQDAYKTMVVLDPDILPRDEVVRYILDMGAIGWINTSLTGRYLTPDDICWMNACTEGNHWHVHSDDRPFIGFCVSPKVGDTLLSASRKGEVIAKVECDGRRHEGEVDVVTGVIPGEDKKEFWLISHLYEPLASDNSLGVITGICIAKVLKTLFDSGILPKPKFTLRLVSGLEMYGFAAYVEKRGGNLRNEVVGAMNLDGLTCRKGENVNCWLSPKASPFFGNSIFEEMANNIPNEDLPDIKFEIKEEGAYFDDMFLADPTVGIPVIWTLKQAVVHHNSCQTMDFIQIPIVKQYSTFYAAFTANVLTTNPAKMSTLEEPSISSIEKHHDINNTLWKIAETIIPERITRGFPFDLAKVPKEERRKLPDGCIYGPFARVLANMDGNKSLKYLIQEAEIESKQDIKEAKVREYIGAIEFLAEYGYLKNKYTLCINKEDIIKSLKDVGIKNGNLVLVHSGLSHFGHIEGGADTVIDAFLDVIGKEGTLLLPTFTSSYIYFEGECAPIEPIYRPFDKNSNIVNTGKIPSMFLKREGVIRSLHPSHSVAGIGPLANKCLVDHLPTDPPTCRRSPFGKLLENNGKMIWFGADLATTTFFHFLEDELNIPYLGKCICRMKKEDGTIESILIEKHLPGHRDFYRVPAEESKMYRKLIQEGLIIKKAVLGFGEIKVIEAEQMYALGIKALKECPTLLLCDDKECRFCSRFV